MSAYEALLKSNAMDTRWNLPICPMHANPSIYTAYAVRVLASHGELFAADAIILRYEKPFLADCEKSSGLITTFPGHGVASHDDMYGAAYLSKRFAGRAIDYLIRTDGVYREGHPSVFRFLFLMPALKAFAGFTVGAWSQIQFSIHCMFHLFTAKEGQTSDHLMIWLAYPAMSERAISGPFVKLWASRWIKRGYSPKAIFSKHYLTEVPWFGEFAKETFD